MTTKPQLTSWSVFAALYVLGAACGSELDPPDDPFDPMGTGGVMADSSVRDFVCEAAPIRFPASAGYQDAAVDLADDFFPMADGNTWTYAHIDGSRRVIWEEVVTMTVTATSTGAVAFSVSDTPGPGLEVVGTDRGRTTFTRAIWVRDGTAVRRVYKEVVFDDTQEVFQIVEYVPGFVRFDDAWLNTPEGQTADVEYMRTLTCTTDRLDRLVTEKRVHSYTVESTDATVIVPAGTFEGCLQIHRQRVRSVVGDDDEKRYWFCPGVGKVKEVNVTTDGGGDEELIDYDVQ